MNTFDSTSRIVVCSQIGISQVGIGQMGMGKIRWASGSGGSKETVQESIRDMGAPRTSVGRDLGKTFPSPSRSA
jgi:hypothetical protein